MSGPAATRSATSRCSGRSGTASTATRCATSGAGRRDVAEFASRFTGSSDLYEGDGRRPSASINFITAHDGFTLADLVSYNEKHNEANLEDNRDGTDDNRSWNCGVEGPTDDPEITALRERQQRNFLATLLLSQGVPMMLAGDESAARSAATTTPGARTTSSPGSTGSSTPRRGLLEFTRRLLALRREHPVFRRTQFLDGERLALGPAGRLVVPAGRPQDDRRGLADADAHALGVFLNGEAIGSVERARRADRRLLVRAAGQRPLRGHHCSRCRRAASARAGRSSCRPPIRARRRRC